MEQAQPESNFLRNFTEVISPVETFSRAHFSSRKHKPRHKRDLALAGLKNLSVDAFVVLGQRDECNVAFSACPDFKPPLADASEEAMELLGKIRRCLLAHVDLPFVLFSCYSEMNFNSGESSHTPNDEVRFRF